MASRVASRLASGCGWLVAALLACGDSAPAMDAASDAGLDRGRDAASMDPERDAAPDVDPAEGACTDGGAAPAAPQNDSASCNAFNWFSRRNDLRGCDLSGIDPFPLQEALLRGVRTFDLVGCSINEVSGVMAPYRCLPQGQSGRFVLVGPGVDLSGAELSGVDLSGADLTGARGHDLVGCPSALPPDLRCVSLLGDRYAIVGPALEFFGADLRGGDLRGISLDGSRLLGLEGCPAHVPSEAFDCIATAPCGFALVGPGVDLSGADLTAADLSEHDLRGTDFTRAILVGTDLRRANLDGAILLQADLRDAELEGAEIEGAATLGIGGCPASLPSEAFRCVVAALPGTGMDYDSFDPTACGEPSVESEWPCSYSLVGPGVVLNGLTAGVLTGADLRGLDLSRAVISDTSLAAVKAYDLVGCPATLPTHVIDRWRCIGPLDDGSSAIVGSYIDLRGADLRGAELQPQDLRFARTTELAGCPAVLPAGFVCAAQQGGTQALVGPRIVAPRANLADADLSSAALYEALLDGANLQRATLDGVDLGAAGLAGAQLRGASLVGANLGDSAYDNIGGEGARLGGADLTDADLRSANLRGAMLEGAQLAGAQLAGAVANGIGGCPASLPSSDWKCVGQPQIGNAVALVGPGADLRHVNLEYSDLSGANLTDATLEGALLTDADLSGVTWSNTVCPDGTNSDNAAQTCADNL